MNDLDFLDCLTVHSINANFTIFLLKSSQVNDDNRKQAWKPLFPSVTNDFTNNITINNFYRTKT